MQTLFEAAKDAPDGTRFKFHATPTDGGLDECRKVISKVSALWALRWGTGDSLVCHSFMDRTDFEIIQTGPWKPTRRDEGWMVNRCNGEAQLAAITLDNGALQSREAAEHFAKMQHILIGLHNMPGACKGYDSAVCWNVTGDRFFASDIPSHPTMSTPFDTAENAKSAADWANEELRK